MSYRDLEGGPSFHNALRKIDHLSARDPCTVELIEVATCRSALEVLDPTFLLDWAGYEDATDDSGYILVYCYTLTHKRMTLIRQFAQSTGRRALFIGHYCHFGEPTLMVNPWRFLGYISRADFIVTDSYHGTILALQYRKPFCSFVGSNYKVGSVLRELGLMSRDSSTATSLADIARQEIDYASVCDLLSVKRTTSEEYLERALGLPPAS